MTKIWQNTRFYLIFLRLAVLSVLLLGQITEGQHGCGHEWTILWAREVGNTPFAAAPLLCDVDLDGHLDIVAAPFTEEVTVLSAETGQPLQQTNWPFHSLGGTVHSSPFQFDVDGDGRDEILLMMTDGELLVLDSRGQHLQKGHKLPDLKLSHSGPDGGKAIEEVIPPQVLATPVLRDLNQDGRQEELVVPVTYTHGQNRHIGETEEASLGEMVVTRIIVLNLTSMDITWKTQLEFKISSSGEPGYLLHSPTVVDLDGDGRGLEIVIGTSSGKIHVLDAGGKARTGYPYSAGSAVAGQVTVADLNTDGKMDMVVAMRDGRVMRLDIHKQEMWTSHLRAPAVDTPRLADFNGDGHLDVLLTAEDGKVWVLSGDNGKTLPGWPLRVGSWLTAGASITNLSPGAKLDVISLSDRQFLHVISDNQRCRSTFNLGEASYVPILSHDLVHQSPGLEMLVATQDGTLICIGRRHHYVFGSSDLPPMDALTSDLNGENFVFTQGKYGIKLKKTRAPLEVTGGQFEVEAEILGDYRGNLQQMFKVEAHLGKWLLHRSSYATPGRYKLAVSCPETPAQGVLKVKMTDQLGQVYTDSWVLRCNESVLTDLQWLIILPSLLLGAALVFLYGFPETDILPFRTRDKKK